MKRTGQGRSNVCERVSATERHPEATNGVSPMLGYLSSRENASEAIYRVLPVSKPQSIYMRMMMKRNMVEGQKRIKTCPKCKYSYSPRVPNPKSCPMCKQYFKEEQETEAAQA